MRGKMTFLQAAFTKLRGKKEEPGAQESPAGGKRYGTFFGVYMPSALAIFGVVMYLRLGVILGQIGLVPTLLIIAFSSLITLLVSLSISSIATNMKVDNGGVYYIISRSLGIDFGSAVGIPLYLAQSIGIAFYMMGFSETLHALVPSLDPMMVSLGTLAVLGILSFYSTDGVMKTQMFIFATIAASLVSLFWKKQGLQVVEIPLAPNHLSFWAAFAIFFPAVTGIEAGVSMSGLLKNSRKSLPFGTIAANLTGLVVYLALAIFLWKAVPSSVLAENSMICLEIARWKLLVIVGIFGATLSSALGAIICAPRTLQAIADDGVVFKILGKGFGKNQEPRIAVVFTLLIGALFISIGSIDMIAPILTMFFLISYGTLNLVCGLESLMHNPSWRPSFAIPAWVCFTGALLCLLAMLMINAGATIMALVAVFGIYFFRGRKLSCSWDDICFGILMFFTKATVYRLKNAGFAPRNWRPHLLVFSPSVTPPQPLMDFTSRLTSGNSFLTFANILEPTTPYNIETTKKAMEQALKKYKMQAFVDVEKVEKMSEGYKRLILTHGIGPITHNTIILPQSPNTQFDHEVYPELIQLSQKAGKNVLLFIGDEASSKGDQQIDVWWDSSNRKTSELLLVLAYMYQSSGKRVRVTIKSLVNTELAREKRLGYFVDLFSKSRLNLSYNIYVCSEEEELKMMQAFSQEADLTFVALPQAQAPGGLKEIRETYLQYLKGLKQLKKLVLAVGTEPVDFHEIFR